ncbi:hypothetical protein [Corticimicrobacter populi]|uniref:Phage tail protein n=1 Tax=Corticimicrobacter populi TaxID=2175229 RepID=A0A2V1K5X9_9BURK|nr:hypothetical protein [Corticimicrobacter populi]PWF25069.1 hypothetical protein DD235_02555 [Corticimicrobacter populi]
MATRIYKTPFAATGDKESLATADQPDGKVSLQAGWTPDYELPNDNPAYRPVGRMEMNGILSEITESLGEVQQYGYAVWRQIVGGWAKNARVFYNGGVFVSSVDANETEPGAAGSMWMSLSDSFLPVSQSAPTSRIGSAVYVLDRQDLLQWMTIGGWTGYASPRVGEIEFGWTPGVLPWQIAAEGGVYSKAAYPALYARFQASGLLVPAASWVAGEYKACDVSGTQFRVPDLRNQFLRMTGTDADTANARVIGGKQADAYREHSHRLKGGTYQLTVGSTHASATWGSSAPLFGNTSPEGGSETRPINIALAPRLHV